MEVLAFGIRNIIDLNKIIKIKKASLTTAVVNEAFFDFKLGLVEPTRHDFHHCERVDPASFFCYLSNVIYYRQSPCH